MIERIQTPYAVLNIDVQNDFCPGGSLAVKEGDLVVPVLNAVNHVARHVGAEVILSRDWHPVKTTHFAEYAPNGDGWPPHCIQETAGAAFHPDMIIDPRDVIISKGMGATENAYSAFDAKNIKGLDLDTILKSRGVRKLFVGGLATDYCVLETVLDALHRGYRVSVMEDAVRAVNLQEADEAEAWEKMLGKGAQRISSGRAIQHLLAIDAAIMGGK